MKRRLLSATLALGALCCGRPVHAALLPPLPAAQASFQAGGMRVDVYGTPNKPALIFIPGMTCGPWEWAGEIRRFMPQYTIYALTLPGFEGQPAIAGPLFPSISAQFWTLVQSRHIEKPVVIGHSLGGTLAILLAEQHPERLRAIVAVDGMPVFPGTNLMTTAQRSGMAQRMAAMLQSLSTPAAFEAAEKNYALESMITSPADIDQAAPLAARSDANATAQWMREDIMLDLRRKLRAITIPMLEIAPFDASIDASRPFGFATAAQKQNYYTALLAGARTASVQMLSPARHFIMYDQPDALHDAISAFLAAH